MVAASILTFEFDPPLSQFIFVTAIILFIVVIALFGNHFCKCRDEPRYFLEEITLLPSGFVEIDNKVYKMLLNSRIGLLGCSLRLLNTFDEKIKPETLFIFKANVSECDYARLCRAIKRNIDEPLATQ